MVQMVKEGTLVQGDYGKNIEFALYESDETTLYDLSSADSIVFNLRKYNESTVSVSGTCSVYSTSGTVRYLVQSGDTDRDGDYIGEIKVYESGAISTWTPFWIHILEEVE